MSTQAQQLMDESLSDPEETKLSSSQSTITKDAWVQSQRWAESFWKFIGVLVLKSIILLTFLFISSATMPMYVASEEDTSPLIMAVQPAVEVEEVKGIRARAAAWRDAQIAAGMAKAGEILKPLGDGIKAYAQPEERYLKAKADALYWKGKFENERKFARDKRLQEILMWDDTIRSLEAAIGYLKAAKPKVIPSVTAPELSYGG